MNKKKINIAIEQLQKVHRDMNDCANRFILKDAIDQLQNQVKNCSIPDVRQQSELLLQCYKEGFQAAVDSLVNANEAVKNKTLQ